MHLNGPPVASFDPEGLIFAAGIDSRQLKLYDLRTFDKVQKPYARVFSEHTITQYVYMQVCVCINYMCCFSLLNRVHLPHSMYVKTTLDVSGQG